jgi:OOP family OmpA-OmpF porin
MRNLGLVLLLIFSSNLWSAESRDSGFYAGIALGFAELDDDGMGDNLWTFDDNSGTFHAYGGYQFNRYLAAELSLDSLGTYEGETLTADIDSSYSALLVSMVGRLPLGAGFSLYAQGGGGIASIYQWVDGVIGPFYFDDEYEANSGFAVAWGGGLSYVIPDYNEIEIRAGYLRTDFEVDAYTVNGGGFLVETEFDQSIEQFYLGAAYHF